MDKHAVFATCVENNWRCRVSLWLDWSAAQDLWSELDDRRRAGELPHLKYLEVRAVDDPRYKPLPYEPWEALPVEERPKAVKLSRPARERLLDMGRRAGNLQDAADAMFAELVNDAEWSHLEAVTISEYTWAAAAFCFPHEARTW